ncbi:MAG: hypothetical protein C0184_09125 [Chloroflexus aggregans]|uniref:DUF1997 domain-containing protein n=1 Tax=Chloroflexus aggregans TaxID=152260 RepID=A0A2J6X3X2_9CHLR|nr:MAG: hypothetical protein C0184_09125 [Chloroflexus aggregans]
MPAPYTSSVASDDHRRAVDLSGAAVHLFRFNGPLELAYEYFCDIPAVFSLLPDVIEILAYGPNRYRLIVGATAGHGHAMAGYFDIAAVFEPFRAIRITPVDDGPLIDLTGFVFPGQLFAEAIFYPHAHGTDVEYNVELAMTIPVPKVLWFMPGHVLQAIGERAMEHKMNHMIGGFSRAIDTDFHAWLSTVRE